jgi:hypothetical protein
VWTKLFGIGDLDGPAFTRLVAKLGVESGRFENPVVDADAMQIKSNNGLLNLHNYHHEFLRIPRRKRLAYIQTIALAPIASMPETWEQAKPLLLPVIRSAGYVTHAPLQAAASLGKDDLASKDRGLGRRPLAPGVFETVVVDTPVTMMTVANSQLADWGVTIDEALDVAHANLRKQSQDPFRQLAPGLWVAPWNDNYAAARATLPELLQRVCTDPLVAIPSRDSLFVVDAGVPHAFEMIVDAITEAQAADRYHITPRIFRLDGKTLREYTPPSTAPVEARHAYDKLLVVDAVTAYNDEKGLREKLEEEDVFYASLLAFESQSGELITRATWTKGVDTLLPPVQAIAFIELDDNDAEARMTWEVPWDAVVAEPGLLTQTDDALPRWRTGTFPSSAWLAKYKQE